MLFDTHCHVNDEAYAADREAMLQRAFTTGLTYMMCPGTDIKTSAESVAMTHQYKQIYAAVGIHPEEAASATPEGFEQIRQWIQTEPKVVAIGEVGLDYHWPEPSHEIQQEVFIKQVQMAVELDVPIDIHDREAHGDTMDILRQYGKGIRGVFHCYSGSAEIAQELLKLGWYLGFDGPLTYKNAKKTVEVAKIVPLDRVLLETDSPYMAPVPVRGTRNDSRNVFHIAAKFAELRGMEADEVIALTSENGKRLFGIE